MDDAITTFRRGPSLASHHGTCFRGKGRRAVNGVPEAGVPQEGTRVEPQAKQEDVAQARYVRATRREKGRLLTEEALWTKRLE